MIDHRYAERYSAFALTEVRNGDHKPWTGLIYNISHQGAFILTNSMHPHISGRIEIRMPYIKANNTPIWVPGRVTHCNYVGFGLVFPPLGEEVLKIIRTVAAV